MITQALKHIKNNSLYCVPYLAPHQNNSRNYIYGHFELLGKDLTEKQIIIVYTSLLRKKKLERIFRIDMESRGKNKQKGILNDNR